MYSCYKKEEEEMLNKLPKDFDPEVYLELNPDVKVAGVDPAQHYLEFGIKEKRDYTSAILHRELAKYSSDKPSNANAFDLFDGVWSTYFEDMKGEKLTKGNFNGTNDSRMEWLASKVTLNNQKVLELGPLEAAHTLFLEKNGADVVSVEGNIGAFLRCLIVKNQYSLTSKFLLGDFNALNTDDAKFDLVCASGVLYHMAEPVKFLEKFSRCSDRLFLWTHYFESDFSKWNNKLESYINNGKWNYKNPEIVNYDGLDVKIIKQQYGDSLGWSGFCGGPEDYSYWIDKNDLLNLLSKLGFSKIEIAFDEVNHQNVRVSVCLRKSELIIRLACHQLIHRYFIPIKVCNSSDQFLVVSMIADRTTNSYFHVCTFLKQCFAIICITKPFGLYPLVALLRSLEDR